MSQIVKVERKLEFHMGGGGGGPYISFDTDDSATILYLRPTTDDTGYLAIGDGTTDMDVKIFLGSDSEFVLFDVGNSNMRLACPLVPNASDGAALGTSSLMFSDLFLASGGIIYFNNTDVTITHSANLLTMVGGGLTMGATAVPAGDFILWPTQTNGKVWLDVDGDTNGAWYFGADDYGIMVRLYGDTAKYGAHFDPSGDTNGAWYFGANDYGIDVAFYGQTIANSMIWDASANALVFTAGGITMGTTSKLVLPVKASGSTTRGDFWLDTTLGTMNFYDLVEYKITATAV